VSNFDLQQLVKDVLENSELNDPRDIAAEVSRQTPSKVLREAYEIALVDYVRNVSINNTRSNPIIRGRTPRIKTGSAKRIGIRDWWQRAMRDRVYIDSNQKIWKPLGDCGFDDLMLAADSRRAKADAINAKADQFERLANLLKEYGVDCVSELPREAIDA